MNSHLECYFTITDSVVKYLKLDSPKRVKTNLYQMLEKYLSVPSLHFIRYTEFALFNAVVNSSFPPYTYTYIVSHTSPVKKKPRWYDSSPPVAINFIVIPR